jgi:hypothetical protein
MFQRLRYSWRTVFLAGVGALFSPHLAAKESAPTTERGHVEGTVLMKYEGRGLFVSENGGSFQPLELGETPEAESLWNLLRKLSPDGSAVRVPVDRRIVADGGVSAYRKGRQQKRNEPSAGGQ